MKIKVLSFLGFLSAILLFVVNCGLAIHEMGCNSVIHGMHYYERFPFCWDAVAKYDWIVVGLLAVWYALLIIPWIQYFKIALIEGKFSKTLVMSNSFGSVMFTIFNLFLIIASTIWFIRTGKPDDLGLYADFDDWWRDVLLIYVVFLSKIYIISGIIVIVENAIKIREAKKGEMRSFETVSTPIWYWLVAAIPFVILAFTVADARWDFFL